MSTTAAVFMALLAVAVAACGCVTAIAISGVELVGAIICAFILAVAWSCTVLTVAVVVADFIWQLSSGVFGIALMFGLTLICSFALFCAQLVLVLAATLCVTCQGRARADV